MLDITTKILSKPPGTGTVDSRTCDILQQARELGRVVAKPVSGNVSIIVGDTQIIRKRLPRT